MVRNVARALAPDCLSLQSGKKIQRISGEVHLYGYISVLYIVYISSSTFAGRTKQRFIDEAASREFPLKLHPPQSVCHMRLLGTFNKSPESLPLTADRRIEQQFVSIFVPFPTKKWLAPRAGGGRRGRRREEERGRRGARFREKRGVAGGKTASSERRARLACLINTRAKRRTLFFSFFFLLFFSLLASLFLPRADASFAMRGYVRFADN